MNTLERPPWSRPIFQFCHPAWMLADFIERLRGTAGNSAPMSHDFRVLPDPRSPATEADLEEQVRFALQVRDKITAANEGVIESRNLKHDLTDRSAKMTSVAAFAPLNR